MIRNIAVYFSALVVLILAAVWIVTGPSIGAAILGSIGLHP